MSGHFLPRWGAVSVSSVDYEGVQAWVGGLTTSGLSGASVRKVLGVFASVLDIG